MKPANIETLIQHNNELLDWKYSASKILNNIDLQKVGKLINVPLGADVSTEILPFIEKSIKDNSEMKEMLSKLLMMFTEIDSENLMDWSLEEINTVQSISNFLNQSTTK